MNASALAVQVDTQPLMTDLGIMLDRPFGVDASGRAINHVNGKLIIGPITFLQRGVGERVQRSMPAEASRSEVEERVAAAQTAALGRLVEMLNAAIPDDRYRVTPSYLLEPSHRYSYEFWAFVIECCQVISGDADFASNHGALNIPREVVLLTRPLGLQRVYEVMPRLASMFTTTDLRVVRSDATSALIHWHTAQARALTPPEHLHAFVRHSCHAYQGTLAAVPEVLYGLPFAAVRQIVCQLDGPEYCEWEFTWQSAPAPRTPLWIGPLVSIILLAGKSGRVPAALWLSNAALALLPGMTVRYRNEARRLVAARARQERQLLDRRESHLIRALESDQPVIVRDVDEDPDPANRRLAQALGVHAFLGAPLIAKDRRLGVLSVDNGLTGRPIVESDATLLFTVGNEIAGAVENAQLYRTLEEQNRMLEQRVEERTADLARANAEAHEARARRLRQRTRRRAPSWRR